MKPGQTGIVQEVQQHTIYKLQTQNGKLAMEEMFSYPGGAYGEYLYHNDLYQLTLDDTNVSLSRVDLTTGKKRTLPTTCLSATAI